MKALLVLAAALLLPQEKNEAEELFKKVEVKLGQADTLQFTFNTKWQDLKKKDMSGTDEGTIIVQKDGKARLEFTDYPVTVRIASNGKVVGFDRAMIGSDYPPIPTPQTLSRDVRGYFLRTGATFSIWQMQNNIMAVENDRRDKAEGKAPLSREDNPFTMKITQFKKGTPENVEGKAASVIQFNIEGGPFVSKKAAVKLWVDPRKMLPVRMRVEDEGEMWIDEFYKDYKLNAKTDPQVFEVSKEDK